MPFLTTARYQRDQSVSEKEFSVYYGIHGRQNAHFGMNSTSTSWESHFGIFLPKAAILVILRAHPFKEMQLQSVLMGLYVWYPKTALRQKFFTL